MIRPLEVPQFEVQNQNNVQKAGLRDFFFFKSLFQKFIEIICNTLLFHVEVLTWNTMFSLISNFYKLFALNFNWWSIYNGQKIMDQFIFKWSDNYKCLNLSSKVKTTSQKWVRGKNCFFQITFSKISRNSQWTKDYGSI